MSDASKEGESMNQLDMKGRNAIVTGGASGIGLAISRRLVQSGANVSIWDLN
jgi:NAD(P)-dependent dehydrogenase (short-subunit alcohol dehydrogenase family)